jgi:hypothetical protein
MRALCGVNPVQSSEAITHCGVDRPYVVDDSIASAFGQKRDEASKNAGARHMKRTLIILAMGLALSACKTVDEMSYMELAQFGREMETKCRGYGIPESKVQECMRVEAMRENRRRQNVRVALDQAANALSPAATCYRTGNMVQCW